MKFKLVSASIVLSCLIPAVALAQGGGFGGGGFGGGGAAGAAYNAYQNQPASSFQSSYANTSEFIAVVGTAELTLMPESLRLVFAVTAEAESSNGCAEKIKVTINNIRGQLNQLGINDNKIVEDFIVVVPKYRWELSKFEKKDFLKEIQTGFRMQSNLHVLCQDEDQANRVMSIAFQNGVTEIISFDYWHSQLDGQKTAAMKKALEAARSKAEILLSIFDERPKIMNVNHSTKVSFPQSLYKTIQPTPVVDQSIIPYNWNNYLKIPAHRPLVTFYQGSTDYADVTSAKPPMNPEILVRSQVTLTYESPSRKQRLAIETLDAQNND